MVDKPRVIIHIHEDGQNVIACGDVDVFTVCELSPNDRVYQHSNYCTAKEVDELIGNSPIGSASDSRHAALRARILGEPFKVIDGAEPSVDEGGEG